MLLKNLLIFTIFVVCWVILLSMGIDAVLETYDL